MPPDIPHLKQIQRLAAELDRRQRRHRKVEPYIEAECPIPRAVTEARLTTLYRYLMPVAEAPWGSPVIDSKLDRLEVSGIEDENKSGAERVWREFWQANGMDAESKLAHGAALLDGRAMATVWPRDGMPEIALDDVTQMVVEFEEGSRQHRTAALRRWSDEDSERIHATLYRPDGIWKFQGPENSAGTPSSDVLWEPREVEGEDWPLRNPLEVVPVVEVPVNRRLKPGRFPYARGEYEHCVGLLDRINLLTFLGLVIAFWMGFPLRGVTGDKIRRRVLVDDSGDPILDEATQQPKTEALPPFESRPDTVVQLENPEAKIWQLDAADRKNLSIYPELDQLAVITKTPRHYFPLEAGPSNIGSEAIMAFEGGMHAAVTGHKATMGEGWEEVCRLGGMMLEPEVELSPQAAMQWMKHESRSLAEQADAFVKLAANLPWIAAAEVALNVSQDQIARWQAERATDPLVELVTAAQQPAERPEPPQNGGPPPPSGETTSTPAGL